MLKAWSETTWASSVPNDVPFSHRTTSGLAKKLMQHEQVLFCNELLELHHGNMPTYMSLHFKKRVEELTNEKLDISQGLAGWQGIILFHM